MFFHQNKLLKAICCVVSALYVLSGYSQSQHQVELADKFLTSEFVDAKPYNELNAVPSFHVRESTRGFQYFSRHWLRGVVIDRDTQIATSGEISVKLDD